MLVWNEEKKDYVPDYRKIWCQKLINCENYPEQHKNPNTSMPITSEVFYGTVQIGHYRLTKDQMDEILEPAPIKNLPKEQLVNVLDSAKRKHVNDLGLADLQGLKLIAVPGETKYHPEEYILYASKHVGELTSPRASGHRASVRKKRGIPLVPTDENPSHEKKTGRSSVDLARSITYARIESDEDVLKYDELPGSALALEQAFGRDGHEYYAEGSSHITEETEGDDVEQKMLTAHVDIELEKKIKPKVGDIRVRYCYKTAAEATILAQQYTKTEGSESYISFRTFNFLKLDAPPDEPTGPTKAQVKRNEGFFKICKSYVGGVAISFIERAELGSDYEMGTLLNHKLDRSVGTTKRRRVLWYIWLACAYYMILLPFTAELAFIPLIGGCLLKWHSQTLAIILFALLLSVATNQVVAGLLWCRFRPWKALARAIVLAVILVIIFKVGESVPSDYAKFLLGYF